MHRRPEGLAVASKSALPAFLFERAAKLRDVGGRWVRLVPACDVGEPLPPVACSTASVDRRRRPQVDGDRGGRLAEACTSHAVLTPQRSSDDGKVAAAAPCQQPHIR
eukprot:359602-Chlamydomonas_euryale.AAC.7